MSAQAAQALPGSVFFEMFQSHELAVPIERTFPSAVSSVYRSVSSVYRSDSSRLHMLFHTPLCRAVGM
jgi:hypothetical protein